MAFLVPYAAHFFGVESRFNCVNLRKRRQATRLHRRDYVERWRVTRLAMRGHVALQRFEGCATLARRFPSRFDHSLLYYWSLLLFAVGARSLVNASIARGQIRGERDHV